MRDDIIALMRAEIEAEQEKDSIEVGTPSKGGAVKIYINANKPDEARQKIKNALDLRVFAAALYDESRSV